MAQYAPLIVGLCSVAVVLAFVAAVIGRERSRNVQLKLIAAIPPLTFVAQEFLERYLYDGSFSWGLLVSMPFVLGLAAQVPFALLAASIAFALGQAAERLSSALRCRQAATLCGRSTSGRFPRPSISHVAPCSRAGSRAAARPPRSRLDVVRAAACRLPRRQPRSPAITRSRHTVAWGVLAAAVAFAFALVAPPSAFAHASLVATTPTGGAVLERSPTEVVLRFDEPVSTVAGSVRVFDGEVQRVDSGEVTKPSSDEVAVGLPAGLADGTYTVAWRVLSADSHPIRGAFVFSVGEPTGDATGVVDEVLDAEAGSEAVDLSLAVVRFVGLALILLCVGGAAVLAFVAETRDARPRLLWIVLATAAAVLAVDSLAWIALTGVKAAGFGLDAVFRWSLARDVIETGFGQVWLGRALLAVALAVLAGFGARSRSDRLLGPIVFVASAIAVTLPLSGHARVEGSLAVLSDAIHVAAAGVWVGGLAFLALLLVEAGGERWSLAAKVVPRFSTLALASVIALVAAGLTSGFLEVRSWQALWHTTYGQLLLVKVALLLPLVALGAFNNRISVPRLRSGAATPEHGVASCGRWQSSSR